MAKAQKIADGHYRTEDGRYEIVQSGETYYVSERQKNRYVIVGQGKTLGAAEKELAALQKSDEPAEEITPAPVEEVTEEG